MSVSCSSEIKLASSLFLNSGEVGGALLLGWYDCVTLPNVASFRSLANILNPSWTRCTWLYKCLHVRLGWWEMQTFGSEAQSMVIIWLILWIICQERSLLGRRVDIIMFVLGNRVCASSTPLSPIVCRSFVPVCNVRLSRLSSLVW
jgi:hypothetical protein